MLVIVVFGTTIVRAEAPSLTEEQKNAEMTVPQIITKFSNHYNLSSDMMTKIAMCESSMNSKVIHYNDGGSDSIGLYQYKVTTFNYWSDKLGEKLKIESAYDQTKLASYMIKNNQGRQWTCYRKLKTP